MGSARHDESAERPAAAAQIAGGAQDGCLVRTTYPLARLVVTADRIEVRCRVIPSTSALRKEVDCVCLRRGKLFTHLRFDSSVPGVARLVFWTMTEGEIEAALDRFGWPHRWERARRLESRRRS